MNCTVYLQQQYYTYVVNVVAHVYPGLYLHYADPAHSLTAAGSYYSNIITLSDMIRMPEV